MSNILRPLRLLLNCQSASTWGMIGLQRSSPHQRMRLCRTSHQPCSAVIPQITVTVIWCVWLATFKVGRKSAGYMSILLQVPIHGWLGSRAESWEVWHGWLWLIWLLLPRWGDGKRLDWKPETSDERKQCISTWVWLIPHITWQKDSWSCCVSN